jgi:hypothetical protein
MEAKLFHTSCSKRTSNCKTGVDLGAWLLLVVFVVPGMKDGMEEFA